jgi:ferredoxin
MDVRLQVDWILCDGYGLCGDLLPDVIRLDDWRYPILDEAPVDRDHLDDAQRAVDCCPMKALRLERVAARSQGARG